MGELSANLRRRRRRHADWVDFQFSFSVSDERSRRETAAKFDRFAARIFIEILSESQPSMIYCILVFFQEHVPKMDSFPALFTHRTRPPGRPSARPPVRPSWITGYQTGSCSSISQFTGYQTGSCSSISQFTGYQNGSCSSISQFAGYQNGSISNIFMIPIHSDGIST